MGRRLGVKYLLEGSVRQSPSQVRIGVELVDASSGTEMWTEYYDRPLKDIFSAQDEMIRKVATIRLRISTKPNNWQKRLSLDDSNSTALTLSCTIDYLSKRFEEAVAACQRSVAINPNYARAYVELSSALAAAGQPQEAIRTARTAMRLDPTRADFYLYFIAVAMGEMGRYQEAIPLLTQHIAENVHARFNAQPPIRE